jgi:TonB-linked SusC/RagA family outer membrane protein
MIAFSVVSFAQNRTITGSVVDENGAGVPSASIIQKGTDLGTSTDANGKFSIVTRTGVVLVVSATGFQETEIPAADNLVVTLKRSGLIEDEVVVIAYGTAKKGAITGSIATMNGDDLAKRVATNISSALEGAAPGISVAGGNGQPGTGVSIRSRGFGSFAVSSAPLYVVDGAVYDGDIAAINQDDVESISLLKDATSAALYGSRAGNGVIIITTKKGKSLAPQLNLNLSQGYSSRGTPEYDRVNVYDYYPMIWQGMKNNLQFTASPVLSETAAAQAATDQIFGQLKYNPFNVPNNQIVGTDGKLNPNAELLYNDFDWYGPLTRMGNRTNANMSVAGKNDKTDYYISFGYLKDNGWMIKSDFERFNARVSVNSQIKSWLRVGINLSGASSNANTLNDAASGNSVSFVNPFVFARNMGPIYPVHAFDATGAPIMNDVTHEQWYDYGAHPGGVARPQNASPGRHVIYEMLLNDYSYKRLNVGSRAYAEVRFLKNFTFTPTISIDFRNDNNSTYQNSTVGDGVSNAGYVYKQSSARQSYTFNQILRYNKSLAEHSVEVLAGHENYDYQFDTKSAEKTAQILAGNTEFANFVNLLSISGYKDLETLESYFSRVSYDYQKKYFLEGSVRTDGSSRFSPQSRWGTFFSIGGSWSTNKENFMKNVSWVNDLRLKVSYGQVGNNALNTLYAYQAFYDLGWNNGSEPGLVMSSIANPGLKWESSNTFNAGVSFSLFKARLYGEIEFYKRGSDHLIFSVPLSLSDPVTSVNRNIGSMYNTGVDIQLGGDVVKTEDFIWQMTTNWSLLKNKITKMPETTPTIVSGTKRREKGKDIYQYWLRQYAGVDPSDGAALYIPAEGTAATNIRVVDGKEYVVNQSFAKFDYSGTAIPDLSGSVINNFSYKNISLSFLITYQIGGLFYDANYAGLMSPSYGRSLHKDVLNSWTTTNTTSDIPRIDIGNTANINAASSRWLIDASYLNIRSVNLSYNFPKHLLNRLDLSGIKFFVSGENLSLFSKRKGMNPTESFDGTNSTTYLPSRIVSFGFNMSF